MMADVDEMMGVAVDVLVIMMMMIIMMMINAITSAGIQ